MPTHHSCVQNDAYVQTYTSSEPEPHSRLKASFCFSVACATDLVVGGFALRRDKDSRPVVLHGDVVEERLRALGGRSSIRRAGDGRRRRGGGCGVRIVPQELASATLGVIWSGELRGTPLGQIALTLEPLQLAVLGRVPLADRDLLHLREVPAFFFAMSHPVCPRSQTQPS